MDFEDSLDEAAWRARCREFLDSVAKRRRPGHVRGYRRGEDAPGVVEKARAFQSKKWEAGFALRLRAPVLSLSIKQSARGPAVQHMVSTLSGNGRPRKGSTSFIGPGMVLPANTRSNATQ